MIINTNTVVSPRPRVLIADDSRIVRATLIKYIETLFEFREALDGEQAWETLLIDPNIRVVITDLSMPKLDGYGLLERIRSSKIVRIRSIPVVVVSGSDEQQERDRAKAAGATDLITKGIGAAQLLSRLDILSKLVDTQQEFEHSLEALARDNAGAEILMLSTPEALADQAQSMLTNAITLKKNFVVLAIRAGVKHTGLDGIATPPPASVVHAIGQLLQRTVRQSDSVAMTGPDEFTLATGSIHFAAARQFAQRMCSAIADANLVKDGRMAFIASCGVVSLAEFNVQQGGAAPDFSAMCIVAHRRASTGLDRCVTGIVGPEEEAHFREGAGHVNSGLQNQSIAKAPEEPVSDLSGVLPDVSTFLRWIVEGKRDEVRAQIASLPLELRQIVELLMAQSKS